MDRHRQHLLGGRLPAQRLDVARCPEELGAVFAAENVSDDDIDKMTYQNAMRWYSFDPFAHIGRSRRPSARCARPPPGMTVSIRALSHHKKEDDGAIVESALILRCRPRADRGVGRVCRRIRPGVPHRQVLESADEGGGHVLRFAGDLGRCQPWQFRKKLLISIRGSRAEQCTPYPNAMCLLGSRPVEPEGLVESLLVAVART